MLLRDKIKGMVDELPDESLFPLLQYLKLLLEHKNGDPGLVRYLDKIIKEDDNLLGRLAD